MVEEFMAFEAGTDRVTNPLFYTPAPTEVVSKAWRRALATTYRAENERWGEASQGTGHQVGSDCHVMTEVDVEFAD
jgi:hypothetical protein